MCYQNLTFFDLGNNYNYTFLCDVDDLLLREGAVAAVIHDTTNSSGAANNTDGSDALDLKGIYALLFFPRHNHSHIIQ